EQAPRAELAWSPPPGLKVAAQEAPTEIQQAAYAQSNVSGVAGRQSEAALNELEPEATQSEGSQSGGSQSSSPATQQEAATSEERTTDQSNSNQPDDETEELLRLPPAVVAEEIPQPDGADTVASLDLQEVVVSVRNHFPLIQQAVAARAIASGEILSAQGAFDHKLEGFSESQPLDFYENYRSELGVKRDTFWGGSTFAKYKIGRGIFEPWYEERETNKGGEFKTGFMAPVIRDRWIDSNRAELWQAQLERRRIEPVILAEVIASVRDGSVAYWNWVAAGANYRVAEGLLELAQIRTDGLETQVELEQKAPIDLVDNQRIIVSREAKLIDARRKLEQAAVKLSLFLRTPDGVPLLTDPATLPAELPVPTGLPAPELLANEQDTQMSEAERESVARA
ncbi:MAG: TolC family protein, partial [Lacipirellulaceae bacterium]